MSDGRLQRCIRDLAALNALPSLCVGRTPDEALAIVLDALPTALTCDFIQIALPRQPPLERGKQADGLHCFEAEIPTAAEHGTLVAGRATPLDPETDRVLVRTAANIIGTVLATANVLEVARRKDDFLAMLGHELRNPLAPILTAVELLARDTAVRRERDVIDRNTRHLARLVDDLLDISRVTRGHVELRREIVTLAAILDRAVELAAPIVTRNRHQLRVARADDVVVEGDPIRLAQIFGNLLTNAAKFTPAGGEIDVAIRRTPGRVQVTVRDNGCGIAHDQLKRIFEPFVQADRERDALRGGLGLGLAIVHDLVQRHGGSVTAASEGRGRGSAFTVELPTAVRIEHAATTSPVRPKDLRADVRVLVVDDNVDIAELLSEALQCEGFATSVAFDGRSALETWRTFQPHAGVLDVGLPDLDGYSLAKTLRAEHGARATLIAATGYGQPNDRARAADAGFDCHLVKPVSVRELVAVLEKRVLNA